MRPLDPLSPRKILVRAPNWVGDAVMSLPALRELARSCPQAQIDVLARRRVKDVYASLPEVSWVRLLEVPGPHQGPWGRLKAARELRSGGYDWAVLFQNAFEAAFIAWAAGIRVRIGYSADARRLLLTHAVRRTPEVMGLHQSSYYIYFLWELGLAAGPPPPHGVPAQLHLSTASRRWAQGFVEGWGLEEDQRLMVVAPGAAYGPTKRWPAERFGIAAREIASQGRWAIAVVGAAEERELTARVVAQLKGCKVRDLAGMTELEQAMALVERASLVLCNDSGIMHVAAALGVPTVGIFGSTDPALTAPIGPAVRIVRVEVDCSPCRRPRCPRDLRCLMEITPGMVVEAAGEVMGETW